MVNSPLIFHRARWGSIVGAIYTCSSNHIKNAHSLYTHMRISTTHHRELRAYMYVGTSIWMEKEEEESKMYMYVGMFRITLVYTCACIPFPPSLPPPLLISVCVCICMYKHVHFVCGSSCALYMLHVVRTHIFPPFCGPRIHPNHRHHPPTPPHTHIHTHMHACMHAHTLCLQGTTLIAFTKDLSPSLPL